MNNLFKTMATLRRIRDPLITAVSLTIFVGVLFFTEIKPGEHPYYRYIVASGLLVGALVAWAYFFVILRSITNNSDKDPEKK